MPLYKAQADRYSTTEHIVGQWINGATLYEKTVEFGTLPNATTKSVAHGLPSTAIKFTKKAFGINATGAVIPVPYPHPDNSLCININLDNTNINIYDTADRSAYTGYVTIRYTKT